MLELGLPDFRTGAETTSATTRRRATRGIHAEPLWDKYYPSSQGDLRRVVDLRPGESFGQCIRPIGIQGRRSTAPRGVGNSFQAPAPHIRIW